MAGKLQLRKEFFTYRDDLADILEKSPTSIGRIMEVVEQLDEVFIQLMDWYKQKEDNLTTYSEGEKIAKLKLEKAVVEKLYIEITEKSTSIMSDYTSGKLKIEPSMLVSTMESTIIEREPKDSEHDMRSEDDKLGEAVGFSPSEGNPFGSNFPQYPREREKSKEDEQEMKEMVDMIADSVYKKLSVSMQERFSGDSVPVQKEGLKFRPDKVSTPAHRRTSICRDYDMEADRKRPRDIQLDKEEDYCPRLSISDRIHGLGYLQDERKELYSEHEAGGYSGSSDGIWNKYIQKVQMPQYNGKGDFESWWSAFEAIIDKGPEPAIVKFLHLKSCLEGEAKEAIKGFPHTASAYEKAKERLYDKFGGIYRGTNRIYDDVKSFPSIMDPKDHVNMTKLLNLIDQTTAKLVQINRKWELGSGSLTSQLVSKLPFEIVYKFNEWRFDKSMPETMYALTEFLELYISRCQIALDLVHGSSSKKTKAGRTMITESTKGKTEGKGSSGQGSNVSGNQKNKFKCKCCKGEHGLWACQSFKALTVKERWEFLNKNYTCFKCLSSRHSSNSCDKERPCGIDRCKLKHHRLLHIKAPGSYFTSTEESSNNKGDGPETEHTTTPGNKGSLSRSDKTDSGGVSPSDQNQTMVKSQDVESKTDGTSKVMLTRDQYQKRYMAMRTIPIKIVSNEKELEIVALVDEASTSSYINERVVHEMNLRGFPFRSTVNMFDGHQAKLDTLVVPITISGLDGINMYSDFAEVTKRVASDLEIVDWDVYKKEWPHLQDIPFPKMSKGVEVDMLLGLNFLHVIRSLKDVAGGPGTPIARLTPLGWTCAGIPTPGLLSETMERQTHFTFLTGRQNEMYDLLTRFWEWEEPSIDNVLSDEDQLAEKLVRESMVRHETGYKVRIPWKAGQPYAPDNYIQALKRLENTEKQLMKTPKEAEAYSKGIHMQIDQTYLKKVKRQDIPKGKSWILPHFPVIDFTRESTKVRSVNDSKTRFKGFCISDHELTGPKYQQDICVVLTRFRKGPVCLGCDISEMYKRIWVYEDEIWYQLILWRDFETDRDPDVYANTRVTFGRKSSPYIALKVSKENALKYKDQYPRAVETILLSTYMDDSYDSVMSLEEGLSLHDGLLKVWEGANMVPRKWITNSEELLNRIPIEERCTKLDFLDKEAPSGKTLGLLFYSQGDYFGFKMKTLVTKNVTSKRTFLKSIAVIYDPLGFLGPVTIRGKVYFQEMWARGLDWDESLPDDLQSLVTTWLDNLKDLVTIKVKRALIVQADYITVEIHCFCDASEWAYGAICFIVASYGDTSVSSNILGSKVKVAPIQTVSIPRLELQAGVIGTKLATKFCDSLGIMKTTVHFWTDSADTWYWIHSRGRNYKPYVNNRIGFIQGETNPEQWRHVGTKLNIADVLTRGLSVEDLKEQDSYWKGPAFIVGPRSEWPKQDRLEETVIGLTEKKKDYKFLFTCIASSEEAGSDKTNQRTYVNAEDYVRRYSTWEKAVRVIAYIRRFIDATRKDRKPPSVVITGQEYRYTEYFLIKCVQQKEWPVESRLLARDMRLHSTSPLLSFLPFLDENGVMRSKSRLEYSESVGWDTKYPIILPRSSVVTDRIILFEHTVNGHSSPGYTLAQLRLTYTMVAFREKVKRVVSTCPFCKLYMQRTLQQQMAPLPLERVTQGYRVFEFSSVDYAGPFYTKFGRGITQQKRWICLFCCLKTRAVHLEMAIGLHTDAFLNAFYKFTARRGVPTEMLSDNGTNFVSGSVELSMEFSLMDQDAVQFGTASIGVTWKFLPSGAPHMGGVHESLVKTMKRALNKVLAKADVNDDELYTAMVMVEGLMNARPLTYVSGENGELLPLTPSHFLAGTYRVFIENSGRISKHEALTRRWRLVQDLVSLAWERWMKELIPELGCRKKWFKEFDNVSVGDIVLVIDATNDRGCWPLGKILGVYSGRDGLIRTVDVKVGDKIFRKPIVKLIPIVQMLP